MCCKLNMKQLFLYFVLIFTALQLFCPVATLDIDTICGARGGCTAADNASVSHDIGEFFCSLNYHQNILYVERCGYDYYEDTVFNNSYRFYCSQTESGKFCNSDLSIDIPPACEDRTTCTTECQSFLTELGDSGCCTDLYFTTFGYRIFPTTSRSRTSCPIAEKCHLTVDEIPRSTGSMQCNDGEIFIGLETYCTIRIDLKQKTVNKLYANSCLRDSAFASYAHCDQYPNGTYCSFSFGKGNKISRHCSLMTNCTSIPLYNAIVLWGINSAAPFKP